MNCTACSPGTWATVSGATSADVCTPCQAGTWSLSPGADSPMICIDCAEGTWSDREGVSAQDGCTQCRQGTWSNRRGATDESTCRECEAGFYQPALGQASKKVCLECAPGTYSLLPGVGSCAACPAGSYAGGFGSTTCSICPAGMWTYNAGSLAVTDCTPCAGGHDCWKGANAYFTIQLLGLEENALTTEEAANLGAAVAATIAAGCGVEKDSVIDEYGHNGTASVSSAGVTAYVWHVPSYTANELSEKLYGAEFRTQVAAAATEALQGSPAVTASLRVHGISVEARHFVAATTTVTTSTQTVTETTTTATTSTDPKATVYKVSLHERASAGGFFPTWAWFVLAGLAVGGATLLICIVIRRRKHPAADDDTSSTAAAGGV